MKLVSLVLLSFAFLAALTWAPATAEGAPRPEPGELCARLAPERLLAVPEIAADLEQAIRANDAAAIARMQAAIAELRAAHGCAADGGPGPGPASALPPGHPPIPGDGLPPGHPRIPVAPALPLFQAPGVLTI